MKSSGRRGTSLLPILLVNFTGTLGYSIVLPFLVVLVLGMGGNALTYGLLGATYSGFQLIGAPVLGRWSDHYGRKKILLLSQAGTFAGWALFLLALFLPEGKTGNPGYILTLPLLLIFFARALDGLTGGNISVANAYLADITPHAERKKNFGRMSAFGNMGLVLGPAVAGGLGATTLGIKLPVLLAIAVSGLAVFMIRFGLKDIPPKAAPPTLREDDAHKLLGAEPKDCYEVAEQNQYSFRSLLRLPAVGYMLTLYFLIFLAFNFFYVAFPVYVAGTLHWNTFRIGVFFSVLSGALVLVQGPVLTALSKKYSGTLLTVAGCLLLAAGFVLFRSKETGILYAGLALFSLGNGIMWPSFQAILSNVADDRYQGAVQGLAGSAGSLASIIGLVAGAFIYKIAGANTFLLATGLMVVIAAAGGRLGKIERAG